MLPLHPTPITISYHRILSLDPYVNPQKYNPNQPLSTTIYSVEATLEFTTRLAKILAKKTGMPIYVGNSISFASTGLGGTMEEELEAFKQVVAVALDKLQPVIKAAEAMPDGVHVIN